MDVTPIRVICGSIGNYKGLIGLTGSVGFVGLIGSVGFVGVDTGGVGVGLVGLIVGVGLGLIDPDNLILPLPDIFVDGPDPVLVFKLLPDLRFESALDTPVGTFRFGVPGPILNFAEALTSSLN
jgi:hypothetical protein